MYICNASIHKFIIEITDPYNRTITQSRDSYSRKAWINQLNSFTDYTIAIYARTDFGVSSKSEILKIQTNENGRFNQRAKDRLVLCLFILVPLARIADLTGHLLNSSTAFITWNFLVDDHRLLNGKFRAFAVTIYENFSRNYSAYFLVNEFLVQICRH
jgi:hypothetical protein